MNIRNGRETNLEDWVFDFQTDTGYKRGVLEVKGANTRTSESNLTQCSKWTDQYYELDKKISKPIFISNQYKDMEYPASKEKRLHFEKNEIDYAKMKSIC